MKRVLQLLLAVYKRWISPALPNACRFVPTCSEYAMEAIERHGALVGLLLAGGRLLRCHPLARAGYDPVPHRVWWRSQLHAGACAEDHCPLAGEAQR